MPTLPTLPTPDLTSPNDTLRVVNTPASTVATTNCIDVDADGDARRKLERGDAVGLSCGDAVGLICGDANDLVGGDGPGFCCVLGEQVCEREADEPSEGDYVGANGTRGLPDPVPVSPCPTFD